MTLPTPFAPMGALRQWITYRLESKAGKMDKVPCYWQTGNMADAHNPAHWTTYEQALANAHLANRGEGCGTGFVLTANDPFWCVDIDKCRDANGWSPLASELCKRLEGAAIEVSQSGRGLHIFGSGPVPTHQCKNTSLGLEMYTTKRFMAITGTHARGDCAADVSDALASVIADYFQPKSATESGPLIDWTSAPCDGWDGPDDDDDLIERARQHKPKPSVASALRPGTATESISFDDLWTANVPVLAATWPPNNQNDDFDRSSADMSLAMRLAYWTGRDCERIERLMRLSGLARDKYERRGYIVDTVMKAAGQVTAVCQDKAPPAEPVPVGEPVEVLAPDGTLRVLQATDDKTSLLNVEAFLSLTGRSVAYDEFADQILLDGKPLTDQAELLARADLAEAYQIKFSKETFGDGLRAAAYRNTRHPLRDWLATNEVAWDGVPRIDSWLTDYLGVASTTYSQAVGAIFLTAAVRRVRQPGCKFDEVLILEGEQGTEKSSAVAALCPKEEWFLDDFHMGMDSKQLLEVTAGKWIVEAAELNKLKGRAAEHVKSLLSRRVDIARMAYGRNLTQRPRQWVAFASTNDDAYFDDPTGNRRFWPVKCGTVRLSGIERDRGQLWAEAAQRESSGASIRLPKDLWGEAAIEQEARRFVDPIEEILEEAFGHFENGKVWTSDVWSVTGLPIDRRSAVGRKLTESMRRLGWAKKMFKRSDGKTERAFFKGTGIPEICRDPHNAARFTAAPPDLKIA